MVDPILHREREREGRKKEGVCFCFSDFALSAVIYLKEISVASVIRPYDSLRLRATTNQSALVGYHARVHHSEITTLDESAHGFPSLVLLVSFHAHARHYVA